MESDPRASLLVRVHGFYSYIFVQVQPNTDADVFRKSLAHHIELAFLNYLPA